MKDKDKLNITVGWIQFYIALQTSNHMLGPKPFPMDRLLAIFYSICEGKVAPSANIFMQVGLKYYSMKCTFYVNLGITWIF